MTESVENPCPFCAINESDIVLQSEYAIAIFDRYPVSPGHLLVIPKRHESDFFNLRPDEKGDLLAVIERARDLLNTLRSPDGFNVGINIGQSAGQTIFHAHVHVIPRYEGDMDDPRGGVRGGIPGQQKFDHLLM